MKFLPACVISKRILDFLHPSLSACLDDGEGTEGDKLPYEGIWEGRVESTLVADDWVSFLILWHVFWPGLLIKGWWRGEKWTRVSLKPQWVLLDY
jgi:hypothetical protein